MADVWIRTQQDDVPHRVPMTADAMFLTSPAGVSAQHDTRRDLALLVSINNPPLVAALIIPESVTVVVDGVERGVGVHHLRHATEFGIGSTTYWTARSTAVEPIDYDTEQHGTDLRCVVTKKRLAAGDPIVVCPGSESRECGLIYSAAAWTMAFATEVYRCPQCGFRPQTEWHPPVPTATTSLDELFELSRTRFE